MTIVAQNRDVYVDRNDSLPSYTIPFTFEEFNQVEIYWSSAKNTVAMLDWHKLEINTQYTITRNMVGGTVTILNPSSLVDENGDAFARLNIKSTYPYQSVTPHQTNYSQANSDSITDNEEIQTQQIKSHVDYIDDVIQNDLVRIIAPSDANRVLKIYQTDKNIIQGCRIYDKIGQPIKLEYSTDVEGHLTVALTLVVGGAAQVYSLNCLTQLTVGTNATIGGTLDVTGATTLSATLDVIGHTNLSSATLSGNLIVNGTSTLKAVTATTIETSSNVKVGGTLEVTGATQLKSTLNVVGHTSITSLYGSGSALLHDLTINLDLNVGRNAFISGNLTVNGLVTLRGNVSITGTLTVTGNTTLNATQVNTTLDVYGATTLHGNATVNGNFVVDGTTTLNQYTVVKGVLQCDSSVQIFGAIRWTGITFMQALISPDFAAGKIPIFRKPDPNLDTLYIEAVDYPSYEPGEPPIIDVNEGIILMADGVGWCNGTVITQDNVSDTITIGLPTMPYTLDVLGDIIAQNNISFGGFMFVPSFPLDQLEMSDTVPVFRENPDTGKVTVEVVPLSDLGSSGAESTVSKYRFAMGGVDGDGKKTLVDSLLSQDLTNNLITTTYTLNSGTGLRITSGYTGKHTAFKTDNNQNQSWDILYNLRGIEDVPLNIDMPLYMKRITSDTLVIYPAQDLIPKIIVDEPMYMNGVATWLGHDSRYVDKHILSNPITTMIGNALSNLEMLGQVLVTSSARDVVTYDNTDGSDITIDLTLGSAFASAYTGIATEIILNGTLAEGHSVTLFLINASDTAEIVWPSDWMWPFGADPDSSAWKTYSLNIFSITKISTYYHAVRVRGGGNADIETEDILVLGTNRDYAPLNFYDTLGNTLETTTYGKIYGNTINGMVFNCQLNIKAHYSSAREVSSSSGVLTIEFTREDPFVTYHILNEDLAQLNFVFDTQTIPVNIFFRFTLVIVVGTSSQTSITLPTDVYIPNGGVTNVVEIGMNGANLDFVRWPDGDVMLVGGLKA